jgi:flagellar basal-body rod modification protein FlgD
MATAPIGQVGSTTPSQATLSQEDFLRILTTQLSFQDPLKPMDNQQFMAQMAQFAALEQTREMNGNLETLLSIQAAQQSIGLLGKTVVLSPEQGAEVGVVTSLRFSNGVPLVTLRTSLGQTLSDVGMNAIVEIR